MLFYLEIIELNFCKLNKNTRRNIQIRGEDDFLGRTESGSRSQSIVELTSGYYLCEEPKGDNDDNKNNEMQEQTVN